ncbi:hypothetical protein [Blastococcus sp. PRF04-17]|uniref:hypothetical protein n=1 Tax=Blastococcus sp. PRF04-17 TaxID=2933797 RepID=UPI001FF2332E|nr:hypothetical protein [Blastococcus sp. PRF04-17]UOY01645.1 hypothetical protein MVA48_22450 [Blastococcus sp. PRF04-17]
MTAVIDRPARPSRGQGYGGFNTALDVRSEHMLAEHLRHPLPTDAPTSMCSRRALTLAARIVDMHGMPVRHDAARQQLAGHPAVYDRYFRLPEEWTLTGAAPACPLTWADGHGNIVIDFVRTAPPSHPLADRAAWDRLAEVTAWAQSSAGDRVSVRILSIAAPAMSLVHQSSGFAPLQESPLGVRLAADPVSGTMVDVAAATFVLATRGAREDAAVAR